MFTLRCLLLILIRILTKLDCTFKKLENTQPVLPEDDPVCVQITICCPEAGLGLIQIIQSDCVWSSRDSEGRGRGPAHLIVMMAENGDMEVEVFIGFQNTIITGLTLK